MLSLRALLYATGSCVFLRLPQHVVDDSCAVPLSLPCPPFLSLSIDGAHDAPFPRRLRGRSGRSRVRVARRAALWACSAGGIKSWMFYGLMDVRMRNGAAFPRSIIVSDYRGVLLWRAPRHTCMSDAEEGFWPSSYFVFFVIMYFSWFLE